MTEVVPVRRALISTYDKTGVAEFAAALHDAGVEIISTGSTGATIRDAGVPVTAVSDVTGFNECLEGRVKTLHPHIHAALLADRTKPAHMAELDELGIAPIDMVVLNLYPFSAAPEQASEADRVELIDIGGPTMLRAAAKNFDAVTVVLDHADHERVLAAIADGGTTRELRRDLAAKAFHHVAVYDNAIAGWMLEDGSDRLAPGLFVAADGAVPLRYGENPHQSAVFVPTGHGLGAAVQLQGKELSYNNLVDADAAWAMANDVQTPCVAIIKHTNPAGMATRPTIEEAYVAALEGDSRSAFGGIVATNRPIDAATAKRITEIFTEVVLAPAIDDDAREILAAKKNMRVLLVPDAPSDGDLQVRSIHGGWLMMDADTVSEDPSTWTTVAGELSDGLQADAAFAWTCAKHTKSNAIVLVKDQQIVGAGAGQMSRVDAVALAVKKAGDKASGAVLASDAFFPFRDGIDAAAAAGIAVVVQPGGSVKDDDVTAAAAEHGLVMVHTGIRHFKH